MITQKDIDDLVHDFKLNKESFKDKRVSDIYRQGALDVVDLLRKKELSQNEFDEAEAVGMGGIWNKKTITAHTVLENKFDAVLQRLDRIYDFLLTKLPFGLPLTFTGPKQMEVWYKTHGVESPNIGDNAGTYTSTNIKEDEQ